MIFYNLFPLLAGPFPKWSRHLQRAAGMGFEWIFVNPIQYPGFSGSLYSVKDYFRMNDLLIDPESSESGDDQLRGAIAAGRPMGLKFMVDLVINHCAIDSELIQEHPEWFLWEGDQVAHPFCFDNGEKVVWGDLAKFNHEHTSDPEGLFQFFARIIDHQIDLGFDGFRCDAAYQVPNHIWNRLIERTKQRHPETVFLAETLGCTEDQTREIAHAGFDGIFNSSKWWDFHGAWLMEQYALTREAADSISFPESHDTPRLFEELHGNVEGMKQRYLFSAFFAAGVMMPIGFEFGFRHQVSVVDTRPEHWETTETDLTGFIEAVNAVKAEHPVFQKDVPTEVLHTENDQVLLMWKACPRTREEALIILNKDIHNKQHFYAHNLYDCVQGRQPMKHVSPEYRLDYIATPFDYDLRPGQGIILITRP